MAYNDQQSVNQTKFIKVLPDLKPCAVRWPVLGYIDGFAPLPEFPDLLLYFFYFIICNEKFKMLQNEYLGPEIGFDTAENRPSTVLGSTIRVW